MWFFIILGKLKNQYSADSVLLCLFKWNAAWFCFYCLKKCIEVVFLPCLESEGGKKGRLKGKSYLFSSGLTFCLIVLVRFTSVLELSCRNKPLLLITVEINASYLVVLKGNNIYFHKSWPSCWKRKFKGSPLLHQNTLIKVWGSL